MTTDSVTMTETGKSDLENRVEGKIMENPPFYLQTLRTLKFAGAILKNALFYPRYYSKTDAYITQDGKVKIEITRYRERPSDW